MKVIGITGGIGCGKSEVLKYLEKLGAYIVEADKLAHNLMKKNEPAYIKIIEEFGSGITADNGDIDRNRFGKMVFNDKMLLEKLNNIVHPIVKDYIIHDIDAKKALGNVDCYVIEAALLIQDGYKVICDEIWYIYADKKTRLSRLVTGRGGDASKYENIMDNQEKDEFYKTNSDVIIDNNGDFSETQNALKALLNKSR